MAVDVLAEFGEKPIVYVCLLLLFALSSTTLFVPNAPEIFGLVPVNTMIAEKYVWNMGTSCFFETSVVKLAVETFAFFVITRSIKFPAWDSFWLYFLVSMLCCTLGTSAYCFIRFFATKLEEMLLEPIYGFGGVFACILMFGRQQLKGEPVYFAVPLITFQNLPVIVIAAQMLLWAVGVKAMAVDLPFSIITTLVSWSYLRFFYQFEGQTAERGDRSEEFAFVAMFPTALLPIMIPLSTAFYNIFALIGLFPELEVVEKRTGATHHLRYSEPAPPELVSSSNPEKPIEKDIVHERRRAKALKLLDDKMAALMKESDGWDDSKSPGTGGGDDQDFVRV